MQPLLPQIKAGLLFSGQALIFSKETSVLADWYVCLVVQWAVNLKILLCTQTAAELICRLQRPKKEQALRDSTCSIQLTCLVLMLKVIVRLMVSYQST